MAAYMYEWIPYDGSARLVTVSPSTGAFYYNTGANTWSYMNASGLSGIGPALPVFYTPVRTNSAGIKLVYTVDNIGQPSDPPQWWSGATASTFVQLTSAVLGTCCASWRSHMLLGNTTDTADGHVSSRVHWSALGDPGVWSGTASAGSIDLIDGNGSRIMNMLPLQQQLLVYKEEGVHTLTYKAAPFYFTQQLLHPSLTLLGPKAVCAINGGNLHFVMTKEGAVIWDGQTIQPIGRDRVDKTLLTNMAWDIGSLHQANAVWWPFTKEVLFISSYTTSMGAGFYAYRVWIYNVQFDSWWETDMTLAGCTPLYRSFSSAAPVLVGTNGQSLVVHRVFNSVNTTDGTASTAVVSSLQTGFYDYGTRQNKEVDRIAYTAAPYTTATGGLHTTTMQVTATAVANPVPPNDFVSPTFSTVTLTTGDAPLPFTDNIRTMNRLISYRIQHTSAEHIEVHTIEPRVTIRSDVRNSRS